MTNLYDQLIGIPWYRPERYDSARARMADRDSLPETYDVWLERAEQREQETRSAGHSVRRVNVDDDLFVIFCRERDILLDRKARSDFAVAEVARGTKANITDYMHTDFRHGALRKK